jgi:hypothetical protein
MKLGKTLVSFLSLALCFGVASCGGTPASDSAVPSASVESRVLRTWTEKEKMIQNVYFHTVLPEFKLAPEATVAYPVGDDSHLYGCYLEVTYPVDATATAEYKQQLLEKYGEIYDESDGVTMWFLLPDGEGTEYTPFIQLDEKGSIYIQAYSASYAGATEFFDGYFGHYYEGKKFADLYPAFPAFDDGTVQFYDLATWEMDYLLINLPEYTIARAAAYKTAVIAAGWHIYAYSRSDGSKNDSVYTKKGASGAFIIDESAIGQEGGGYMLHMIAGFENSKYTEGEIIGEDSVSAGESASASVSA